MNSETAVNIIGTIILLVIIGGIFFVNYQIDKFQCKKQTEAINYNYEYSYWTRCIIVKPNGKKILLKQLRDFGEE